MRRLLEQARRLEVSGAERRRPRLVGATVDLDHPDERSRGGLAFAWAVHLVTAIGAGLALLAIEAVFRNAHREALLWLLAALAVDGIDGTLARAAKVAERTPRIDGAALDLVIDYLTYVVIPALIIWRLEVLPGPLALPLAALILMSSLYVFARRDMKTDDGYFRGFPALWNVVALYFVVATPGPLIAVGIVAGLIVLTFAPVHVVHPFRARGYGRSLPAIAVVWAASSAAMLLPRLGGAASAALLAVSAASAAVLIGISLLRSVRGPR